MSYGGKEAWSDEKQLGSWPFERWGLGGFRLRADFDYFNFSPTHGINAIAYRLREGFGRNKTNADLQAALDAADELVDSAIEISESEAFGTWLKQEIWLPILDESLNGEDNPAEMLVDSLLVVGGTLDDHEEYELHAALGLWLVGEFAFHKTKNNISRQLVILEQTAIALAASQYELGQINGKSIEKKLLKKRNKAASAVRHKANRENKEKGQLIWRSKNWKTQADAERAISLECHIEKAVAGRWIREFKNLSK